MTLSKFKQAVFRELLEMTSLAEYVISKPRSVARPDSGYRCTYAIA